MICKKRNQNVDENEYVKVARKISTPVPADPNPKDVATMPTSASEKEEPVSPAITGWGTKEPHAERSLADLFSIESINDTYNYVRQRDWTGTVWRNVFYISLYHLYAVIGAYWILTGAAKWQTAAWCVFCYYFSGVGVTAGMHRLWSHKSYTASPALEVFLACGASMAFENSIYVWSRDHRLHHKYSETAADPHDSTRGLFFAHMGWLFVRKREEVKTYGKSIDMDDLKKNKVVAFQHKYYLPVLLTWAFIIPTIIPMMAWGEQFWKAFFVSCTRLTLVHHGTWFVNSISHWQGEHPYQANIWPSENLLTGICALGEGWHNFHHCFPNDYRTTDREFGPWVFLFNFTHLFLDICEKLGFARSMIKVPTKLVNTMMAKHGDGKTLRFFSSSTHDNK